MTAHLLQLVRDALLATLDAARREATAALDGARTEGTDRAANRGERGAVTAQGFLTGAIAGRVAELEAALAHLDQLAPGPRAIGGPGARVRVEDPDGVCTDVLIAPGAPGGPLPGAPDVLAVTPASPLGRALTGARPGDERAVLRGGREVVFTVVDVS